MGALPKIRGTQIGLRDPAQVERLKSAMKAREYAFAEKHGQIAGVHDAKGTYHIVDGHHRMAAALEIFHETGDDKAVQTLLFWGRWANVVHPPRDSRPFPGRPRWQAFRNWIGF
jgi:hypothetical protein